MEAGSATSQRGRVNWRVWAVVPVVLLAIAVGVVVSAGSSLVDLVGSNPPAADQFDIRRVEFSPGEIRIVVRNPQRDDLTIASVTVDDAIVPFSIDGPTTLGRLRSSTIVVPFEWVENDPISVGVTSSTGIQTVKEIAAAVETPQPSVRGFFGYAMIGLLVGVLPIALGLLWLPALRQASPVWLATFMAFTGGLLSFLGVEALTEAFDLQAALPAALGGAGLVLLGVALSFLGMTALSGRLTKGGTATGLTLALLIAVGIGLHNLGEGLAIGASFAIGELQLGAFLIVGFMIHNVTEGLGIATPVAKTRVTVLVLAALALVAGAPAILGAWIGGYTSSDVLGALFFAISPACWWRRRAATRP
jgi:zinc transporter, ZIP family